MTEVRKLSKTSSLEDDEVSPGFKCQSYYAGDGQWHDGIQKVEHVLTNFWIMS